MSQYVVRTTKLALALAVAIPLLLLAHQSLVIVLAYLLEQFTRLPILPSLVQALFSSPVHAQLALESLGGARPLGLGISGWLGDVLHALFPGLFLNPALVSPGALVSAVMDPDSSALGIFAVLAGVDFLHLVVGSVVTHMGFRGYAPESFIRRSRVSSHVAVGLGSLSVIQAGRGLLSLTISPTLTNLRDTGLGMGIALAFRPDPATFNWLMDDILPIAIPIVIASIGLACATVINRVVDSRVAQSERRFAEQKISSVGWRYAWLGVAVTLTVYLPFPSGYFGAAVTVIQERGSVSSPPPLVVVLTPPEVTEEPTQAPTRTPLPNGLIMEAETKPTATVSASDMNTPTPQPKPSPTPSITPSPKGPSKSELRLDDNRRLLFVNDKRKTVVGMNYNVNYTGFPEELKRMRHERDFKLLRELGFNSIIGWGVYDQVTLDVAQKYEIGVIMPFELDPQGAFENKGYRDLVRTRYREFVTRYRDHQAVWGWNPGGDELLHRMDTEQHRTTDKLQHAANLLIEMSQDAFVLDPSHISVIKEPRDWYIAYIDEAIRKTRTPDQSIDLGRFLVYGMNAYGRREEIRDVLHVVRLNSEARMKIGYMVTEYAPFSYLRKDRGQVYASLAEAVFSLSPIGGYAYVFGPDQPNPQAPNPYDPLRLLVNEYSFVDIDGIPVDDALATLSNKWREMQSCCSEK